MNDSMKSLWGGSVGSLAGGGSLTGGGSLAGCEGEGLLSGYFPPQEFSSERSSSPLFPSSLLQQQPQQQQEQPPQQQEQPPPTLQRVNTLELKRMARLESKKSHKLLLRQQSERLLSERFQSERLLSERLLSEKEQSEIHFLGIIESEKEQSLPGLPEEELLAGSVFFRYDSMRYTLSTHPHPIKTFTPYRHILTLSKHSHPIDTSTPY